MSADLLREAAAKVRERAEAATPGPWRFEAEGDYECGEPRCCYEYWDNRIWGGGVVIAESHLTSDADSTHIASWHPVVAHAVADWLDTAGADLWAHGPLCECGSGCLDCDDDLWQPHVRRALAVARAYLGESS